MSALFPVLAFLGLAFGISLAAFAVIAMVPEAQNPEGLPGLPLWVVMVWGPSLAAMILAAREGRLAELLRRAVRFDTVPWEAWVIVALPILLLIGVALAMPGEGRTAIGLPTILLISAVNLILGPLGEELGWRGVMQDQLSAPFGWLAASLVVGVVWYVWHLPLWMIASPQAQIPVLLFGGHVLAYAILMGAAHHLSGGSLVPAILFHLTVNVAASLAVQLGAAEPAHWFRLTLAPLWCAALGAAAYVIWVRGPAPAASIG